MAYSTINKQTDYFNTVAYTGNGASDRAVTSGFATDFVWIKNRGTTDDHVLFDKVRGGTKYIYSNQTAVEATYSSQDVTFESTGVDVGSYQSINQNSGNIVSWHWKANGAGSANTDGTINSTVSANTTAGFSIVTYTGNGVSGATVGHGLGVAPKMIIIKCLNTAHDWAVFHKDLTSNNYFLVLNENNAQASDTAKWQNTDPSSTVFTLGNGGGVNANTQTHVAYCFAEKTGYSKIGSYSSNNNVNGPFVYTGFKPNWILVKSIGSGGYNWQLHDTVRQPSNLNGKTLQADTSAAEFDYVPNGYLDLLSNGFKLRSTSNGVNGSGASSYLYMAFGQTLVGSNNVAATAR